MIKILKCSVISIMTFSLILGLSSCFKDKETFEEYPNDPWGKVQKIELDINGEIIDEAGNPVKDVVITANNQTAFTDKNGVFVIKKSLQNPDFIHVKAEKKGFFNGARVIRGTKDRVNSVKIILLKQTKVGTVKSAQGGEIKVDKMKIKFPANGYIDELGKTYTGNVNVAARYLDPTKPQVIFEMPGDLRAVNFQGEEKFLETYGMVAVELTDDSGNKLNLGNGGEAELSFPKPQNSTAHAKMPLWYFDEKVGAWREDGSADLVNGEYVGKVKHFTYWNCDFPYDKVFASGRIVDQNGNPIANAWVGLDIVNGWQGGHGQTDNNGVFLGCIPKDKELELKVNIWSNGCNSIIYKKNVGSFSADIDFKDVTVNIPTGSGPIKSFNGHAVDCNNQSLQNGYVSVLLKGGGAVQRVNLFTDASGNFTHSITPSICFPEVTNIDVVVYDLTAKKESQAKAFNLNTGANDLGNIEVCTTISEFIDLKFGDSTFYTITPLAEIIMSKDSLQQKDVLQIFFSELGSKQRGFQSQIVVNSNPPVNGTYPSMYLYGWGILSNSTQTPLSQNLTTTLTEVSLVSGGHVAGSMNGTMTLTNGQVITVSGSFKVRKI